MKTQLDELMHKYGADALMILGPAMQNPSMVYFTGIVHVTSAVLIKKYMQEPILFHPPMERDEAARTGLKLKNLADYPLADFLGAARNDRVRALAMRMRKMLQDCQMESGQVVLYGQVELGRNFEIFKALQKMMPRLKLKGMVIDQILLQAMMTKGRDEIDQIRKMAGITVETVRRTWEFLQTRKLRGEVLLDQAGKPLTIGRVKAFINLTLAELGAENPEGTIFALGRDGGVPHSSGNDTDVIRLGVPIVFDIFPCQAGGGYYYDFTRTWCLGYAPDEVKRLYDQVLSVYGEITSELKPGLPFKEVQDWTCESFEKMGHATVRKDPKTEEGYVHSVGHGVGLQVHEMPFSGSDSTPEDALLPGAVFTIEPGLYYPSRNVGVRLEDTYWMEPGGKAIKFAEFPMDLVIPMKSTGE
jgi:Xaa-Pro aminopeptidase